MTIEVSKKPAHHSRIGAALATATLLVFAAAPSAHGYSEVQDRPALIQDAKASSSRESHTYRVIYTITESESGKRTGIQRYQLSAVSNGPRAMLKQGTRNPVLTGGYVHEGASDTTQFQFTYLDVGLNLDATLTEGNDGLRLAAKVDQSSMVDAVNPQTLKDPVVKQNTIESSSMVKPGVPMVLGSYDVPGSARHFEIEVTVERIS